jgi:hypothetical protein
VNWTLCPTLTLAAAGVSVTGPNGGLTAIAAIPVFPSLVAAMVAEPVARPVTRPTLVTDATVGSLLDHVTIPYS